MRLQLDQPRSGVVFHVCWKSVSVILFACLAGSLFSSSLPAQEHGVSEHAQADSHGEHGQAAAHGDMDHGHSPYTIWSDLPFWSAIAFIGFVCAIKGLGLWDLLLNSMSDREKAETAAIVMAEADLSEARAALRSSKGRMEALDEKIRETMAEASRDAKSTQDEIISAAEREAKASVERANHEIERVRDQSLNEIFEDMANKVADVTESRLRSELQAGDHERLIGTMLAELAIQ